MREQRGHADGGEHVRVVRLGGEQRALVVSGEGGEGAAAGKHHGAVSGSEGLDEGALRLGGGVGEGEHDGLLVARSHGLQNGRAESSRLRGHTDEGSGPGGV